MNSIPLITSLFKAVLQQSQTIGGRFFITYRNGRDLNNDLLGQVLSELTTNVPLVKYPLVMMAPPVLHGNFNMQDEWLHFRITLCFLRTSYVDSYNNIAALNANTQTSGRPIAEDWNEMANAAISFIRVLEQVMRQPANIGIFRLDKGEKIMVPITSVTQDNASGVKLDFEVSVFVGCQLQDYADVDGLISSINLNNL